VTAVRIGDLGFCRSAVGTNWGSDIDEDEESKTILHLSSSSDDCHDLGVLDEAFWLLPSLVLLLHNGLPGLCLGNSIDIWVVFGFKKSIRLIIGSGSCRTRLCNRVRRVDTNPTCKPKLPSLVWISVLWEPKVPLT
jgi:hypothetical protein